VSLETMGWSDNPDLLENLEAEESLANLELLELLVEMATQDCKVERDLLAHRESTVTMVTQV